MQTKLVEVISLVSLIAFVYWNIFNFKSNLKKAPKTMLGSIGVVLPVLILLTVPWHGFFNIALNSLAIFAILNFFGLLYIFKVMRPFLKPIIKQPVQ